MPSVHFGALGFPAVEAIWEAGFSMDRFTEHTKPTDSSENRLRDYVHKRTDGFNSVHLSRAVPIKFAHLIFRGGLQAGWIGDQPSRLLQNDFRHKDAGLEAIPVEETGSGSFVGVSLSLDRWFSPGVLQSENLRLIAPLFVGAEVTGSSILHDAAIRLGVRSQRWTVFNKDIPSISFVARKGLTIRRSNWRKNQFYGPDDLANTYFVGTATLQLPIDQWWDPPALLPTIEVGMSWHTGLFRGFPDSLAARQFALDKAADPLDDRAIPRVAERLCTVALSWGGGDVVVETYNDACGDKDIGPSFGARFYFRWRNARGPESSPKPGRR